VAEFECEIGLHSCMHEGAYQLMVQHERAVLEKVYRCGLEVDGQEAYRLSGAIGMRWISMG
jgi:hypothetical protein